jgi:hypothetical protein
MRLQHFTGICICKPSIKKYIIKFFIDKIDIDIILLLRILNIIYIMSKPSQRIILKPLKKIESTLHIKNKGSGAGGKNTNKNGLSYESLTDLSTHFIINSTTSYAHTIEFTNHRGRMFSATKQSKVFKHLDSEIDKQIPKGHGCKNPDECFIDDENKRIFIIEKKFQQTSGSVCEKIQTSDFKLWQYSRSFPSYDVVYMYCLSDWFKNNCKAELEYLSYKNVPIFWGSNDTYKDDIIDFMVGFEQTLR